MPQGPATQYAKSVDGSQIAYQVIGDGALDLRKHLFFANVAFDVLVIFALMDLLTWTGSQIHQGKNDQYDGFADLDRIAPPGGSAGEGTNLPMIRRLHAFVVQAFSLHVQP